MPLISMGGTSKSSPIIPPGDPLGPFETLDPTDFIKGLLAQEQVKQGTQKAVQAWDKPGIPSLTGMPIDAAFLEQKHVMAMNQIESGIREAGGNAQYYFKTPEFKELLKDAALTRSTSGRGFGLSNFDQNLMRVEKERYDTTRTMAAQKQIGQEVALDDNGDPILGPDGNPLTIDNLLSQYAVNPKYSPFMGGDRNWNMDMTTQSESKQLLENYFNNIKASGSASTDFAEGSQFGMPGALMKVVTSSSGTGNRVGKIRDMLLQNPGALGDKVEKGFAREFNNSYFDPETMVSEDGTFNEAYYAAKANYLAEQVVLTAEEFIHGQSSRSVTAHKNPTAGPNDIQGMNYFNAAITGQQTPGTQTVTQVVNARNVNTDISAGYKQENIGDYTFYPMTGDNPVNDAIKVINDNASGSANGMATIRDITGTDEQFAYYKIDGVTNFIDYREFDFNNYPIINMNAVEENTTPGVEMIKGGRGSEVGYGNFSVGPDGNVIRHTGARGANQGVIQYAQVQVAVPKDQADRMMAVYYDGQVGKKATFGDKDWFTGEEVRKEFRGRETPFEAIDEYNFMWVGEKGAEMTQMEGDMVKMTLYVPANEAMLNLGTNQTTQEKIQGRYQEGANQLRMNQEQQLYDALNNLNNIYQQQE